MEAEEYYKEISQYGNILYTKDFTTTSGYATVKVIKYKQCVHIVDMLNGEVTNITLLFWKKGGNTMEIFLPTFCLILFILDRKGVLKWNKKITKSTLSIHTTNH